MSYIDQLEWVIYPYLSFAVMIIGIVYRFRFKPLSITSKSSELFEKERLQWGARFFHYGLIFVILGHFAGLFVPIQLLNRFGVSDYMNFIASVVLGAIFGIMAWIGLAILIGRRVFVKRVRVNSSLGDTYVLFLLLVIMSLGLTLPLGYDVINGSAAYNAVMANVGQWMTGFFTFQPNASLMNNVPLIFKIHILVSFLLYPSIPFTRLVHIFTTPVRYLFRKPILFRKFGSEDGISQDIKSQEIR
jgi:nitrate reductase gamma subunit